MKKVFGVLVVIILMLLLPVTASANSAAPNPNQIEILIDDYSNIKSVSIIWFTDGVKYGYEQEDPYPERTRRRDERIISFINEGEKYNWFRLKVTFDDWRSVTSNLMHFEKWGSYVYSVEENSLNPGEITSRMIHGFTLYFGIFVLAAPLIVTLITEWLLSRAFKLYPGKYVVIANLITNPAMNIAIVLILNRIFLSYYLILLMLEAAAAALEFGFYAWKYKEYSKKRLLLFTLSANLLSWGIYYLISSGWFF